MVNNCLKCVKVKIKTDNKKCDHDFSERQLSNYRLSSLGTIRCKKCRQIK